MVIYKLRVSVDEIEVKSSCFVGILVKLIKLFL